MNTKFYILFFIAWSSISLDSQGSKQNFSGKICYTIKNKFYSKSQNPIPPFFGEMKEVVTKCFVFNQSDTISSINFNGHDTLSVGLVYEKKSLAYFYKSNKIVDFSSLLYETGVKSKRKRLSENIKVKGFNSNYFRNITSSKDTSYEYVTEDFPYGFNYLDSKKAGLFIIEAGLILRDSCISSITEDFFLIKVIELSSFDFDPYINHYTIPSNKISEQYIPIESNYKDTFLMEVDARELAHLNMTDLKGKKVTNDHIKGHYTLIDLWATWCQPCIYAMPALGDIYDKYRYHGLKVVSISLDGEPATEKWKKTIEREHMYWDNYIMPQGFDSDLCRQLDVKAIPRYILLDPEGHIMLENAPGPSDPNLTAVLDRLLMGKK